MSDPLKRAFTTEHRKELNLYLTSILMKSNTSKLGEINMAKLDPEFPLVTSSFTMSNMFNIVSKGGTELVGWDVEELERLLKK